jgi:hypothetical protein
LPVTPKDKEDCPEGPTYFKYLDDCIVTGLYAQEFLQLGFNNSVV